MLVESLKHGKHVLKRFLGFPDASVDTETQNKPGWKGKRDTLVYDRQHIRVWSMCHRGESYSFPTCYFRPIYPTPQEWFDLFLPLFEDNEIEKVFWNSNYDVPVIGTGVRWFRRLFFYDAQAGARMSSPGEDKKLKHRAAKYGRFLQETKNVDFNDLDELADYAEQDVVATDEMFQMQRFGVTNRPPQIPYVAPNGTLIYVPNPMPTEPLIVHDEGLRPWDRVWLELIDHPVLRSTFAAERRGFPLDTAYVTRLHKQMLKDQRKLLKSIYRQAGKVLNLDSAADLAFLFEKLRIQNPHRTPKGAVAYNKHVMMRLTDSHPVIRQLNEQKKIRVLISFYIGDRTKTGKVKSAGLAYFVNPKTKRIHPTLDVLGARTGRSSCQNPNLQQIPSRADIYAIKKAFVPPKGKKMLVFDFAGLELRVDHFYHGDPTMGALLRDPKKDMHGMTAKELDIMRDPHAKEVNFQLQFFATGWALAEHLTNLGHPTTVAQGCTYHAGYHRLYPRVRENGNEMLAEHKKNGFITYFTGRRRWVDVDWNNKRSVHKAETVLSNNRTQGAGQDFVKAAIVRTDPTRINVDRAVRQKVMLKPEHDALLRDYARKVEKARKLFVKAGLQYILQVHDEIVWFVDPAAAQDIAPVIGDMMCWRHPFPRAKHCRYSVPLVVEGGIGENWRDAKKPSDESMKFKIGYDSYELEDIA